MTKLMLCGRKSKNIQDRNMGVGRKKGRDDREQERKKEMVTLSKFKVNEQLKFNEATTEKRE